MSKPKPQSKPSINSYSRILIGEWPKLCSLLRRYSLAVKDQSDMLTEVADINSDDFFSLEPEPEPEQKEQNKTAPLEIKDINLALSGPYRLFFMPLLAHYSNLCRCRLELHLSKEDVFKGLRGELAKEDQFDHKNLQDLKFSVLDQAQQQLDEFCDRHYQQWHELLHQTIDQIIELLQSQQINLTELEIKEFHDEEPANELQARFTEISLNFAQTNPAWLDLADYLSLKTKLALFNTLSRLHQATDEPTLQEHLKHCQKIINQASKQGEQLAAEQQKQITKQLDSILPAN